jgi:hypothetical protein
MSWQRNLELLLSSDEAIKASLRLDECLLEVDAWLLTGTAPTQWAHNARSVSDEVDVTCSRIGKGLRQVVHSSMRAARAELSAIA